MKQIPDEVFDQLLEDCDKPEDVLGANGLLASLQKSILERILEAELTDHLGYCKHEAAGRGSGNSRNGHGSKRVLTGKGSLRLEVPRDRNPSFEPQFVAKSQTRLPGFDEEVIPMFAFAPEIRRLMYTAIAIASLHRGLRKSLKTRGSFPNDKAATKLLYLAIRNIETNWKAPVAGWRQALNQFHILFEDSLQGVT